MPPSHALSTASTRFLARLKNPPPTPRAARDKNVRARYRGAPDSKQRSE